MKATPALAALALAALLGAAAAAEEAVMTRPIEAGSLHEGPLDMVAYWTPAAGETFELVATFAPRDGGAPMRVILALAEGDRASFAMPGHPEALYSFARAGDTVRAGVRDLSAKAAAF